METTLDNNPIINNSISYKCDFLRQAHSAKKKIFLVVFFGSNKDHKKPH